MGPVSSISVIFITIKITQFASTTDEKIPLVLSYVHFLGFQREERIRVRTAWRQKSSLMMGLQFLIASHIHFGIWKY